MAKNHAICIGTHAAYWDVDSLNYVGVADTDMDNGTFVQLGAIGLTTNGGYEFTVTATNSGEYVVATPPVGYSYEQAGLDDPRYFYNVAGKPMAVKHLIKGDCLELDAAAFTAAPATNATYATVQASGKLTANTTQAGAHFAVLGTHSVDCGGEIVKTWVLQKLA